MIIKQHSHPVKFRNNNDPIIIPNQHKSYSDGALSLLKMIAPVLLLLTTALGLDCFNGTVFTVVDAKLSNRIIGGILAPPDRYPYYAIPATRIVCGATLIWTDVLVSAAHCNSFGDTGGGWSDGLYLSGNNKLRSRDPSTYHNVSRTIVHPLYDPDTYRNDVMLIILNDTVTVPYAQMNSNRSIPIDNTLLTVIGFGATAETGYLSNSLMMVDLPVADFKSCNDAYYSGVNDDEDICAGWPLGGRDSCYGDSGGPLFVSGTDTVVAIVSRGYGCARQGYPSVNARISFYQAWIQETICSESMSPPPSCYDKSAPSSSVKTTSPVTAAPVTSSPVTTTPATSSPISTAPATSSPVTTAPATSSPITTAPVTSAPVTTAHATSSPITTAPATSSPITTAPATSSPITNTPVTYTPITFAPMTSSPVTASPMINTKVPTIAIARPRTNAPTNIVRPPAKVAPPIDRVRGRVEECNYDCRYDYQCKDGLLCADQHKRELRLVGLNERSAYCIGNTGFDEVCYDPRKVQAIVAALKEAKTPPPTVHVPVEQTAPFPSPPVQPSPPIDRAYGRMKECQYDCQYDTDCLKGLICADEHKLELKLAGLNERSAYCFGDTETEEVCYDPAKVVEYSSRTVPMQYEQRNNRRHPRLQ